MEISKYYPDVIKDIREFKALAIAENPEIEVLYESIDEAMANQFVDTAQMYGIARMEHIVGIVPMAEDTLHERRFRVLAKYNEDRPYTLRKLKEVLNTLCGPNGYHLKIDNAAFHIEVRVELTSKKSKSSVEDMLERITPANMLFAVLLMYNQWQLLSGNTWGGLRDLSWRAVREEVLNG